MFAVSVQSVQTKIWLLQSIVLKIDLVTNCTQYYVFLANARSQWQNCKKAHVRKPSKISSETAVTHLKKQKVAADS